MRTKGSLGKKTLAKMKEQRARQQQTEGKEPQENESGTIQEVEQVYTGVN